MATLARHHALLAGALAFAGCFIEPATPSTFRFECSADAECEDNEQCANGLCQQHCGAADDEPCSQSAPVCLNNYCASVCPIADDVCPAPQSCMSLAAPDEDPGESGVCAVPCDANNPCGDGQVCFEDYGLCVSTCMTVDDCGSGEECVAGFCVPSSSGGGSFP